MRDMGVKDAISNLRDITIKSIREKMCGLTVLEMRDLDESNSPILIEDPDDSDFTFTLDRIRENSDGILEFDGSSCWDNTTLTEDEVGLEILGDIDEYLDGFKDEIEEVASETDPTAGDKKKYVIRFYWRQWVDIEVEAESEEEAYEIAGDKYNNGEYEELPDNFENTDCENVTDYYEENGLPPFGDWHSNV